MRIVLAITSAVIMHLTMFTMPIVSHFVDMESVWDGGLIALYLIAIYSCFFLSLYHMIRSGVLPKWLRNIFIFFATFIVFLFIVCFAMLCFYA